MNTLRAMVGRRSRHELDSRRAARVDRVLELVGRFIDDLGGLIAGEDVDFAAYMRAESAERLRAAVRPAMDAGTMSSPDFGDYAQVRIDGDILDLAAPVSTVAEFDDRSRRLDAAGVTTGHVRRRVRVELILDPPITCVLDHRIEVTA